MFKEKIENLIKEIIPENTNFSLEHPPKKEYGDYSVFLPISQAKNIKERLKEEMPSFLEKIEIAPLSPGKVNQSGYSFLNFYLKQSVLIEELRKIIKEKDKYGSSSIGKGKTMIIDYSSPNIAKPFGIGHLRSTIIGQAIYNIYKFLGWKCIGDNHLGDWGTQFGKLIVAIKRWGNEKNIQNLTIDELEKLYVKFHQEAEKNPILKDEAREWFKKLEKGDSEAKKIWQACVKVSLKEFDRIYQLLDVKIDYTLGESFYEGMLQDIIDEAIQKNVATKSKGALIIKFPNDELPPAMLLKSDGATTYFTRDLATVKYRFQKWNPDLIIYEIGAEQSLHLKQLFRAVELLGWSSKDKFFHVAHGLYRTKSGKFSTRKGQTIHLEDVLKEAILRAEEILRKSETAKGLSEKEIKEIAKIVGIGAVKYNDLCEHYSKDVIFDWDKILNLKGNSAPYLQYTYVRCQSVIKKAKININWQKNKVLSLNQEEESILRTIYKFPEIVNEAAEKCSPNLICNFIFSLAQKYNLFYEHYPIIKAEDKNLRDFRLLLTSAIGVVLKNGLSLLGISAPERM